MRRLMMPASARWGMVQRATDQEQGPWQQGLVAGPTGGAHQWKPKKKAGAGSVPDAHDKSKRHAPAMLTSDIALKADPIYEKISRRFYENPDEFADAFARAWFKLTHRDLGPIVRYRGKLVPKETLIWQDPIPAVDHTLIGDKDVARFLFAAPHAPEVCARCANLEAIMSEQPMRNIPDRPPCPACKMNMIATARTVDTKGLECVTFECLRCGYSEIMKPRNDGVAN